MNNQYLCRCGMQRCDQKYIEVFEIFMDWANSDDLEKDWKRYRWFGTFHDGDKFGFWMDWATTSIPAFSTYKSTVYLYYIGVEARIVFKDMTGKSHHFDKVYEIDWDTQEQANIDLNSMVRDMIASHLKRKDERVKTLQKAEIELDNSDDGIEDEVQSNSNSVSEIMRKRKKLDCKEEEDEKEKEEAEENPKKKRKLNDNNNNKKKDLIIVGNESSDSIVRSGSRSKCNDKTNDNNSMKLPFLPKSFSPIKCNDNKCKTKCKTKSDQSIGYKMRGVSYEEKATEFPSVLDEINKNKHKRNVCMYIYYPLF